MANQAEIDNEEIVVLSMDEAIGRRVHQLLWERRLTSKWLATRLRIDPAGLSRRLRGERGWSTDEVYMTSVLLDVPIGFLFTGGTDGGGAAVAANMQTPD